MIDPGSQRLIFDFIDGLRKRGVILIDATLEGGLRLVAQISPDAVEGTPPRPQITAAQREALLKDPTTPQALKDELQKLVIDEDQDLFASA